jgi:GTP-binding protein EngB required for normal cell division
MRATMSFSPLPHGWLETRLSELRQILDEMGADFSRFSTSAGELQSRLGEGRFRLAVLGQFKRGKSTLLNALLGEPLLPTGVLPLTAIPTILQYGFQRRVHVLLRDGRREEHEGSAEALAQVLTRYVTERENPANRLGVARVEVEHPAPLLARGVEIIDTPGIGSTIPQNTRTAREMLPVCDGALVVLSPDPPITEVEVQFLKAIRDAAARVIFVLTKRDLLWPTEREEILTFIQRVLEEEAGFSAQERVFLVSARQALDARARGDDALWGQSGLGELESFLADFLLTDKRSALQEAIRRKGARLINDVLFSLELRQKAIDLPRKELERRLERFDAHLSKIDRERLYLDDRLAGDCRRLSQEVDQQTDLLADQARKALAATVETVRQQAGPGAGISTLEAAIKAALMEEVDRAFGRATRELLALLTARFQSVQDLHCRDMEALIERIRRTAADLFEVPYLEGVVLDRIETVREPRLIRHRWVTSFLEEAVSWLSVLLPPWLRAKRLERTLREEIEYLVSRNIEELRWSTLQNMEEAIRAFQSRMRAQLDATIGAIRTSVQAALDHQARRELRLVPELRRLERHQQRLAELLRVLAPQDSPPSYGGPL